MAVKLLWRTPSGVAPAAPPWLPLCPLAWAWFFNWVCSSLEYLLPVKNSSWDLPAQRTTRQCKEYYSTKFSFAFIYLKDYLLRGLRNVSSLSWENHAYCSIFWSQSVQWTVACEISAAKWSEATQGIQRLFTQITQNRSFNSGPWLCDLFSKASSSFCTELHTSTNIRF